MAAKMIEPQGKLQTIHRFLGVYDIEDNDCDQLNIFVNYRIATLFFNYWDT